MLRSSAPDRRLSVSTADCLLSSKQATSLAIILNELTANAIKHGAGSIGISFDILDGKGVLEVTDQGGGFDSGFGFRSSARAGLELVESLSRLDLGGDVSFSNLPSGGARVTLSFVPTDSFTPVSTPTA